LGAGVAQIRGSNGIHCVYLECAYQSTLCHTISTKPLSPMSNLSRIQQSCSVLLILLIVFSACTWSLGQTRQPPLGSCTLNLPDTTNDAEAIRALLAAEGELVVKQDIVHLMQLWVEGGYVADAKNTPDNKDDDQYWLDKDAIRHRYVHTVFPGAPQAAVPADLHIEWGDGYAIVTATTQIGDEISPAGDRWVVVRQGRCWQIESLTYNLERTQR
jgi:hypothetical protein